MNDWFTEYINSVAFLLIQNIWYNKRSLLFQLVTFKIYRIIKTLYCFKWLPWTCTWSSGSRTIAPKENCLTDNCPKENCPLTIKFTQKIIVPTQVTSPQKVLRVNRGKLWIVYRIILPKVTFQGCKLWVKSYLLPCIFYRF